MTTPEQKISLSPDAEGFKSKTTPRELPESIFLFKCAGCGGSHFRHAGYVETQVPFIRGAGEKSIITHSESVKVCVNCKNAYVWIDEQVYDVTKDIDLAAWERTEREAQRATGPGGQC